MNISGESVGNFAKVFSLIDKMYSRNIVTIESDNITPLDQRTKFMFRNILWGKPELEPCPASYYIVYEPEEIVRNKSDNSIRKLRRKIRE